MSFAKNTLAGLVIIVALACAVHANATGTLTPSANPSGFTTLATPNGDSVVDETLDAVKTTDSTIHACEDQPNNACMTSGGAVRGTVGNMVNGAVGNATSTAVALPTGGIGSVLALGISGGSDREESSCGSRRGSRRRLSRRCRGRLPTRSYGRARGAPLAARA